MVEPAKFEVTQAPNTLETSGVGSCLCVALYDFKLKIGALAHVPLPGSPPKAEDDPLRFIDKAIDSMLEEMLSLGCNRDNIVAKIVGGSNMFPTIKSLEDVGMENIASAEKRLEEVGIYIVAKDAGGSFGRGVQFDTKTGKLSVTGPEGMVKSM